MLSILFYNMRALGPPTAALPLVCSDEGNATPRHARPTLHHVPCSAELLAQTRQPLAVAFTPMAPPEEVRRTRRK